MNINIKEFFKAFNHEYEFCYENRDNIAGFSEAVRAFDEQLKDEKFKKFVGEFVAYRQDFVSSDREAAAFMFALDDLT